MTIQQLSESEFNLEQVLELMEHLSYWLIRSGVGYTEFTAALKPIFFKQALRELERIEQKPTDSSLGLLSGLHRKDVNAFRQVMQAGKSLSVAKVSEPVSVVARVVGLWLAEGWANQIPFVSDQQTSFESLVKRISSEKHPRSILKELERLGVVREENGMVVLENRSFLPNSSQQEAKKILSKNVSAHLAAGLHNIYETDQNTYLEQAIFADELSAESIEILHHQSLELWEELSIRLLKLAVERCAIDEGQPEAKYIFRFGVYQNDENGEKK